MNPTKVLFTVFSFSLLSVSASSMPGSYPPSFDDWQEADTGGYWTMTNIVALPEGHALAWVNANGNVDLSRTRTFSKAILTSEFSGAVLSAQPGRQAGTPLGLAGENRLDSDEAGGFASMLYRSVSIHAGPPNT